MRVLLVDISTYNMVLPEQYRQLLLLRLKAQAEIQLRRLGLMPHRPGLTYSRGLLIVAAGLKRQGHDVKYIVYSDEEDRQRLPTLLREAEILGISALTPTIGLAAQVSDLAKSVNPSILSVIGGPHVKAIPEETLQAYPTFNVAVTGSGEIVFPELISNLRNLATVPKVVFRDKDGSIAYSSGNMQIKETVNLLPAYELLYRPLGRYAHNVRTQDGCPYECSFCVERRSWVGNWTVRSINSVIKEISYLSNFCGPITLIHFADAIFNLNKRRTLELCKSLAQFKDQFVFSVDTRVDVLDQEIVKAMTEAGIIHFRLGFEDAEDNVLNSVSKGSTSATGRDVAQLIREVSPSSMVHAYWLTGLPGATRGSLYKNAITIRQLIVEEIVDVIGNKVFVPYPGTPYYNAPEQQGMTILTREWSRYDRLSFPVYRLSNLSEFEIYNGFQFLESVLLQAYMDRLGGAPSVPPVSLGYVYSNYVDLYSNYIGQKLE